jgi:hypothetical protein
MCEKLAPGHPGVNGNRLFLQLLQERADKICEMASVMQKSVQIDEENQAREQELMSRLVTENKVSLLLLLSKTRP